MSRLRPLLIAGSLASGLATTPVAAQTSLPVPVQVSAPQAAVPHPHRFLDRFNAANTSHDGRLTLQQVQSANMSWVAKHFAAIDTQHKGYITVQGVRAYRQQRRSNQPEPAASQDVAPHANRFLDRFNTANTSHDGRLTLQQAQTAHLPWVAHNFSAIDMQQKGYITVQDVRAYRQQQMRSERFETN
jgi:Ca2+-binding EF-hand superfamily protein